MAAFTIDPGSIVANQVFGAQFPRENARALAVSVDFSLTPTPDLGFYLDYSNRQSTGVISVIQTVYIDASQTDLAVTVQFVGSNQSITVKGRTQGYYPALVTNPFKCFITSPGSADPVNVFFANFPVQPAQWLSQ